ncbi:MAG: carboxylating nicotinate-nucleotide diphosphorylase [Acidobacteria bacterium]|nr:carboxylating nicotinate-nucleotide diphosphorylase [Acidobacteriota bacterium]
MNRPNREQPRLAPLYPILYQDAVRGALLEDIGRGGDLTTQAIVSAGDTASASIVARQPGRIAGVEVAAAAFRCLDPGLEIDIRIADGGDAAAGETVAVIRGAAGPILTAERTALNFLARLSGVATATRDIVAAIGPHSARVVCTRKTTPGLRVLEKYAVRAGGGANHRFGLDDAVLIKDNHIVVAGGVTEAIRRVRVRAGHMVKVEVEVDTLEQLEAALGERVDAVLLDNMPVDTLAEAVRRVGKRVLTEASGGVTPATARAIAATGVDLISIGWLTHSAPALNLSLEVALKI